MYKDYKYINAGENEIYRYGHKAVEKVENCLTPNENGYISIPVDGGKYWTLGTSEGKFGEFCKINNTIFSVNNGGFAYAKVDTEKGIKLVEALNLMIKEMHRLNEERIEALNEEEEDE